MKSVTTLFLLITVMNLPSFGKPISLAGMQDSIIFRQRHQLKHTIQNNTDRKKRSTLIIYPAKNQLSNKISLPIGFNKNTVQVYFEDVLLLVDKDYIFLPNSDQMKILNEKIMTSYKPLYITYERVTFSFK